MDNLERFITENRESFNRETPSEKVWESIHQNIANDQHRQLARRIHLKWIAGIAAGLLIAVVTWFTFENDQTADQYVGQMDPIIKSIDPQYAIQVKNYNDQIHAKQVALKELLKDYPEVSESLIQDLNKLNKSYDQLRLDLVDNPNQKVLLEAMIENLHLQISILNNQLNLISQIKNEVQNEINI